MSTDILETDYNEYCIVYSCTNVLGIYTIDLIWVTMRKPWEVGSAKWNEISNKVKKIIANTLSDKYTKDDFIRPTQQGGSLCNYNLDANN